MRIKSQISRRNNCKQTRKSVTVFGPIVMVTVRDGKISDRKSANQRTYYHSHIIIIWKLLRVKSKLSEQKHLLNDGLVLNTRPLVYQSDALTNYTRKNAQLVNNLCSQQACNKLVNKFVAMLLFCQVVPSL